MKVIYLGYVVPINETESNDAISAIGNNMQLGFLTEWNRILKNDLSILTFYPISPYKKSKKLFINRRIAYLNDNTSIKIMPFINITIIKHICTFIVSIYELLIFLFRNRCDKIAIVTYHVSWFFSIPSIIIGKIFRAKIICLVSDGIKDTSYRENKIIDLLKKISNLIRSKLIKKYDAYLTINENIIKSENLTKPYLKVYVGVEPIYNQKKGKVKISEKLIKVSYTGALEEYYSIKESINAMRILGSDYELNLYGKGSLSKYLNDTKEDNIKYFGLIHHSEIRDIQSHSDVLLCLLKKDSYLGKYAFPGKVFEYLLSGTPIISYDTPSLFDELKPFLNIIKEETPDNIANSIYEITKDEYSYSNALLKAEEGRKFVLKNCIWSEQIIKIDEFIKGVLYKLS